MVDSTDYEDDINPRKIIDDIKYFYRNGKFPKSKFHSFGESLKRKLKLNESLFEDVNEIDSEGNTLSEQQFEFFKNSKIRDRDGKLLVCCHSSASKFNSFNKGDIGFHFGNREQAISRYEQTYKNDYNLYECYLNITNPIILNCDFRI